MGKGACSSDSNLSENLPASSSTNPKVRSCRCALLALICGITGRLGWLAGRAKAKPGHKHTSRAFRTLYVRLCSCFEPGPRPRRAFLNIYSHHWGTSTHFMCKPHDRQLVPLLRSPANGSLISRAHGSLISRAQVRLFTELQPPLCGYGAGPERGKLFGVLALGDAFCGGHPATG